MQINCYVLVIQLFRAFFYEFGTIWKLSELFLNFFFNSLLENFVQCGLIIFAPSSILSEPHPLFLHPSCPLRATPPFLHPSCPLRATPPFPSPLLGHLRATPPSPIAQFSVLFLFVCVFIHQVQSVLFIYSWVCSSPVGCGNLPGTTLSKGNTLFKKLITFYFKCVWKWVFAGGCQVPRHTCEGWGQPSGVSSPLPTVRSWGSNTFTYKQFQWPQ